MGQSCKFRVPGGRPARPRRGASGGGGRSARGSRRQCGGRGFPTAPRRAAGPPRRPRPSSDGWGRHRPQMIVRSCPRVVIAACGDRCAAAGVMVRRGRADLRHPGGVPGEAAGGGAERLNRGEQRLDLAAGGEVICTPSCLFCWRITNEIYRGCMRIHRPWLVDLALREQPAQPHLERGRVVASEREIPHLVATLV